MRWLKSWPNPKVIPNPISTLKTYVDSKLVLTESIIILQFGDLILVILLEYFIHDKSGSNKGILVRFSEASNIPARKLKDFLKPLHFSNFFNIFQIFINFNNYFGVQLPKILGILRNRKISFPSSKIGPPQPFG